jgi:hypothetical protein
MCAADASGEPRKSGTARTVRCWRASSPWSRSSPAESVWGTVIRTAMEWPISFAEPVRAACPGWGQWTIARSHRLAHGSPRRLSFQVHSVIGTSPPALLCPRWSTRPDTPTSVTSTSTMTSSHQITRSVLARGGPPRRSHFKTASSPRVARSMAMLDCEET